MSAWSPIETVPIHIKDGEPFLARWRDALDRWQVVTAYFGQYGHCFLFVPMGFEAGKEVWVEEGQGVNGSGFSIGSPEISPTEWCEIPH